MRRHASRFYCGLRLLRHRQVRSATSFDSQLAPACHRGRACESQADKARVCNCREHQAGSSRSECRGGAADVPIVRACAIRLAVRPGGLARPAAFSHCAAHSAFPDAARPARSQQQRPAIGGVHDRMPTGRPTPPRYFRYLRDVMERGDTSPSLGFSVMISDGIGAGRRC